MKRVFGIFALAAVLGITAIAQSGAFSKAMYCKGCCHDKCGQSCCKDGCTDGCCQSK